MRVRGGHQRVGYGRLHELQVPVLGLDGGNGKRRGVEWKNSNNVYAGAYDVGLARAVAGGILKVTNGSNGYGTLDAGGLSINGTPLATVAVTGSYSDLSNKPAIPAAQVNSDWTAASGVAQILNRPALAAVAMSGS